MDNQALILHAPVIHIATDEKSRNYELEKSSRMLSNRVQVLSIDDLPIIRNNSLYKLPNDIYVGDVLVRNPFEINNYILIGDDLSRNIRINKYCKIKEIAQKLGAKGCEIVEAICKEEERIWDAEVGTKYKVISGGLSIKSDIQLTNTMGILMSNTFGGSQIVSEKSYNEAIELARQYNLDEDVSIKSLINMRNPNQEYPLFVDSYHFDMSEESNNLLDIAFSLNSVSFYLDAKVKRAISKKETITLDIKFEFPDER